MFNANIPPVSELPSSAQLLRSTAIAAATAAVLLVTAVLPAEYGIDPTGVGRVLGLTQMGEIKVQLQEEAEADRPGAQGAAPDDKRSFDLGAIGNLLAGLVVSPATAQTLPVQIAQAAQSDTVKVTLKPGEGAEVKAVMTKDATLTYSWKSEGGAVNHDTHGEPTGNPNATHSYKKGRGVAGDDGVLTAAFDGHHGWFWRNRGDVPVTITLTASGAYSDLKRVK